MKARKFFLTLAIGILPFSYYNVFADPIDIDIKVGYVDPYHGKPNKHKSPVNVPQLAIDNNILYFITPCDGLTVNVVGKEGYSEYTTVVQEGSSVLTLPSYLSGEYEIQIISGNICFYGYIYL